MWLFLVVASLLHVAQASHAQVAGGAQVLPPEKCAGEPQEERIFSLEGCHEIQGVMGMTTAYQGSCNSSAINLNLFPVPNRSCAGLSMPWPQAADLCVVGLHGQPQIMTCHGSFFVRRLWSLAPPPPRNLRCQASAAKQLQCSCDIDPSLVDEVSFEVSLPFPKASLSYLAPVAATGQVLAELPELQPGKLYEVRVRAHRRGESEGDPAAWSALSAAVTYRAELQAADPKSTRGQWLEVFRVANGAGLPDFLDQHNAADLTGLASYLLDGEPKPITRYCIEVLPIPATETGTSSYAEFASCNMGQCVCMHQADRMIARQPPEEITNSCHYPAADSMSNFCRCSNKSNVLSKLHVGRTAVEFPMCFSTTPMTQNFTLPHRYPAPVDASAPVGHWYSFPSAGRCGWGHRPGEGCSWQMDPLSHTVMAAKTAAWDPGNESMDYMCVGTETLLQVVERVRSAFMPLGLPPCGESAKETSVFV